MHRWRARIAGIVAVVAVACGAPTTTAEVSEVASDEPPSATSAPSPSATASASAVAGQCPAIPEQWRSAPRAFFWPAKGTERLVPAMKGPVCATPVTPYLAPGFNEEATMGPGFTAGAYGVIHRGPDALATFNVTEVAPDTPGLDQILANTPGERTQVGDVTLAWYSAGGHVGAGWVDGNRIVYLIGSAEDGVREAVAAWFGAGGVDDEVSVPEKLPEIETEAEPALAAGLPVQGLPERYTVLPIDPLMFVAADDADSVTIHDNEMEALGAAILLEGNTIVATAIGSRAASDPKATPFGGAPGETAEKSTADVELQTINVGPTSILVAGYDAEMVTPLVDEWTAALEGAD